jgi:T-complex protein 1 subunit theta
LVVDASMEVMPKSKPSNYNTDSGKSIPRSKLKSHSLVRVVKILGGSILDSSVVRGMVFGREPEGTTFRVSIRWNLVHGLPSISIGLF